MPNTDATQAAISEQAGGAPPAPRDSFAGQPPPAQIGEYQILRRLGQGGTSVVYEGRHPLTHRRAAIKVLGDDSSGGGEGLPSLRREIAILERLRHPNIVELLSCGELPGGAVYLVFELVDGPTLKEVIERREKTDWLRALDWMRDAALALDAAWSHHIIHRDIKPANMIIHPEGMLKVGDFGLAKAIHDPQADPGARVVMGTPRYISPEMGLGQSLDFRADMYSLGATFYHVFVGQAPFDAPTARELVQKHASSPPPPPHSLVPSLPDDICDILLKLLRKSPEDRYQSYGDLIADLREARLALLARYRMETLGGSAGAPTGGLDSTKAHPAIPNQFTGADEPEDEDSGSRRFWIGAVILAVLGGAAVLHLVRTAGAPPLRPGGPGEPKSWLARQIEALLPDNRGFAKADRLARENQDVMERLMNKLIRFEVDRGHRPNTLHDAIVEGYATEDQLEDAYQNTLAYDPNLGSLTSPGPNREQGDEDDFVLNFDMTWEELPDPNVLRASANRQEPPDQAEARETSGGEEPSEAEPAEREPSR